MDEIITTTVKPIKSVKSTKNNKSIKETDETSKVCIDDILGPNVESAKATPENITPSNYIDHILNNSIVKFDNKNQTSMFFICYKALNLFCNNMKTEFNCIIPQNFIDKHIVESIPSIIKEYTGNLKKRCKKIVSNELICLGRKLDNKQCTRKKHNGSEFCKSHLIKLSNGRIDQPINVVIRNKRGRKRKVEFDPRQYDNEYITLWEDIVNGEKVLLDSNNNIYTFDLENPQYLGKKTIDTKLNLSKILNDISEKKIQNIDKLDFTTNLSQSNQKLIDEKQILNIGNIGNIEIQNLDSIVISNEKIELDKNIENTKTNNSINPINPIKATTTKARKANKSTKKDKNV